MELLSNLQFCVYNTTTLTTVIYSKDAFFKKFGSTFSEEVKFKNMLTHQHYDHLEQLQQLLQTNHEKYIYLSYTPTIFKKYPKINPVIIVISAVCLALFSIILRRFTQ